MASNEAMTIIILMKIMKLSIMCNINVLMKW